MAKKRRKTKTDRLVKFLCDAVPDYQRESLEKRIRQALVDGWTSIGLFVGEEHPADESDLYGVMPPEMQKQTGKVSAFVPGLPPEKITP